MYSSLHLAVAFALASSSAVDSEPGGATPGASEGAAETAPVAAETSVSRTVTRRAHTGQNGSLTVQQEAMARAAWRYFENNFQPTTCLYNSSEGYPSSTMWDTASALAALVSAFEFEFIDQETFDGRVRCMLVSLNKMEFYQGELPNKAYNTITLEKVDYTNQPGEIGFSAIDLGRMLTWLAIVKERYPIHADAIDRFVLRWKFCNLVDRGGNLYGAMHTPEGPKYLQEGRLGYEEYAATGFNLWGFSTEEASREEPYEQVKIEGVPIAYDGRDPSKFGAHTYVLTEAYLLSGLEFNWDEPDDTSPNDRWHSRKSTAKLAKQVYRAQFRRWKSTGILTARSEHQLDTAPWFIYDTVYSDGVPWHTLSDTGEAYPQFAAVSTKAAVGMDILFDTPYTERLSEVVGRLIERGRGVYEGYYEDDGRTIEALTANTNGIVLETYLYKREGKLFRPQHATTGLWESTPNAEFPGNWQCLPFQKQDI